MNRYLKPPTTLLRLSSCSPKNIPETAVPIIDSATDPPTRTRTLAHNGRSLSHKITAMVVGYHPTSRSRHLERQCAPMIGETGSRGLPWHRRRAAAILAEPAFAIGLRPRRRLGPPV